MKSPNLFPSHCLDAGKSCFIRVAKPACVGRCMVYVRGTRGGLINTLIKSVGGGSLLFQITEVSFLCGVIAVKSQLSHPSPFLLPLPPLLLDPWGAAPQPLDASLPANLSKVQLPLQEGLLRRVPGPPGCVSYGSGDTSLIGEGGGAEQGQQDLSVKSHMVHTSDWLARVSAATGRQ